MLPGMRISDIHTFAAIVEAARKKVRTTKVKAALLGPCDIDTLSAIIMAERQGLIEALFIGDESALQNDAEEHGLDMSGINPIAVPAAESAVERALQMAREGEIELIVKGRMAIPDMLTILLRKELGFRLGRNVFSHVAVMKPEEYAKLILLTDGAVVPRPDLQTKVDLIQNLIFVSERIGISLPRVAIITAVEAIYPQMPATLDGAVLAKMSDRGQIVGAVVDGPLSFDVAVDPLAAQAKGITDSPVAGQADAMVASTIEVANGIYHAMSLYGRCDIGGVIVGGRVPVAVNACADSPEARFHSIVLGVLTA